MGISRAIERVKQARQGGLHGVMSGLGEGLRNPQIPAPLRGAAARIAALLEGGRSRGQSATTTTSAGRPAAEPTQAVGHLGASLVHAPEAFAAPIRAEGQAVDAGGGGARREGSSAGKDAATEPGPQEPNDGTPVDAARVGATPVINATPIQVEAVDATPVEVEPVDASPVDVQTEPQESMPDELERADAAQAAPAKAKSGRSGSRKHASRTGGGGAQQNQEEELAHGSEAAKTLARSTSRSNKKRSGSKANTTSKMK